MKDMQARTKSPTLEGQNHQDEDHGWMGKKSPVDASPLLGRYQKDGKRKFTETNYEENETKVKKRGRKRAKTDIEKANAQNSKFWCPPNVYNFCDDRFPVGTFLPHSLLISFRLLKAN